jgi:putative DNA primase/helicase
MNTKIQHDGTIEIATGRSRRETSWKNKELQWSDLITKLSTTHRTAETHAEYLSSKKVRQDEIKDIGGFVGGYLTGGRRKAGSVLHRQLITLDIDFSPVGIWDDFTLLYGNAAVLYSTHKHASDSPRLRLILPLDRQVMPDEYVAIARRIAGNLGIEYFDHTTFQPERLMYWPSTSKDGVYAFEHQDGPWLCADEVLTTYTDWRDSSEWPVSERSYNLVQRAIKKQGDPLEKPGIVGAFCRTYDIHEAIETYLADVYESCDTEKRYTYKEGSTAAGLITYDDKFAYSHHGTDPVSGKLCNAFDLVRLHLFGLKDEDARDDTPINKMPSYLAMAEHATKDAKVRKNVISERMEDAKADFENIEDPQEEESDDWQAELDVDKKGKCYSTVNNVIIILTKDPSIKGRIAFNSFEHREIALKNLPWRKITPETKYLTDKDDAGIRHYVESIYGITGVQKIKDAIDIVLLKNSFHPVRDYLTSLKWDGEERVDSLLIDYLGAEDSEYVRAVTRKALSAAVARIFEPGAKFDYVLTMVGKEGKGKSTLFDKLGKSWFSDSFIGVQGKEAFEQLQGTWIVEMAELSAIKKAEIEAVKHFISKREDRYRVAFGRRVENFPRQCIFIGTTNNQDFLRGATGNRRFWPVAISEQAPTKDVFKDLTDYEINQVWAEAIHYYRQGEELYLSKELEEIAFEKQENHTEQDERAGMILKYLDTLLPTNWDNMGPYERRTYLYTEDDIQPAGTVKRDRVCAAEIWVEVFGGKQAEMTSHNTRFIHEAMRKAGGWIEYKTRTSFKLYGNQKAYLRSNKSKNGHFVTTVDLKKTTVEAQKTTVSKN